MTECNGKWMLVSAEKVEEFYKAINCSADFLDKIKKALEASKADPKNFIEEFHVNKENNTLRRLLHINGKMISDSGDVNFDTEVDDKPNDGRPAKTTWKMEDNSTMSRTEIGNDYSSKIIVSVSGEELTVTRTASGVTGVQKFKKV